MCGPRLRPVSRSRRSGFVAISWMRRGVLPAGHASIDPALREVLKGPLQEADLALRLALRPCCPWPRVSYGR